MKEFNMSRGVEVFAKKSLLLSSAITTITLGLSIQVSAESDVQVKADRESLEEVIVISQKREQNLQDVGIAITAFSGDQLKDLGYTTTTDISQQTPNLNIMESHPSLTTVSIRGVSQNDFGSHYEAPIAIIVDEVYVGSMGAASTALFDIERVEVLRGPQGTLFGRNATGGLIHYISNKPTEDLEGYASATVGNYGTRNFQGAVSNSLTDNLQGRLAIATNRNDGLMENRIGPNLRQTDNRSVRLQLAWQPTEELDILFKLFNSLDDANGNGFSHSAATSGRFNAGKEIPGPDLNGFEETDGDPHTGSFDELGFFKREINSSTLKVSYDLGNSTTLTSITDYITMQNNYKEDSDSSPHAYFDFATLSGFEQSSQEFRVNGEAESYRWQSGLYLLNIETESLSVFNLDLGPLIGEAPLGIPGFTNTAGLGESTAFQKPATIDSNSWAVFGQTDIDLSDELILVLGLRYTVDERDIDYYSFDGGIPIFGPYAPPSTSHIEDSNEYSNFSYKVQLDWHSSKDTLIFAGVTKGHKAGNYRLSGGDPFSAEEHDQEELTSFETGIKTELLDGSVRFNATAFYFDYKDYQAFFVDPTQGTIAVPRIQNVDATAKGLEVEVIARPMAGLKLSLGATWMNSEVEDLLYPDGITRDSDALPYAPEYSINGLIRYEWAMFDGTAIVQVDFNHSDDFCFSAICSEINEEGAYTVANARATYYFPDDQWAVTAFVSNFTDEEYRIYSIDTSGVGIASSAFAPQRQYGVTVDYTF